MVERKITFTKSENGVNFKTRPADKRIELAGIKTSRFSTTKGKKTIKKITFTDFNGKFEDFQELSNLLFNSMVNLASRTPFCEVSFDDSKVEIIVDGAQTSRNVPQIRVNGDELIIQREPDIIKISATEHGEVNEDDDSDSPNETNADKSLFRKEVIIPAVLIIGFLVGLIIFIRSRQKRKKS